MKRIKVASLLSDYVLLEAGVWEFHAGARGSMNTHRAPSSRRDSSWQTAYERHAVQGRRFYMSLRSSDAPDSEPFRQLLRSPTSVYWRATFEPMRELVPAACNWFLMDYVDEPVGGKQIADSWSLADKRDEYLRGVISEDFVRDAVIENANHDLVRGASIGAAVSMESLHSKMIRARILSQTAIPAFGHNAIELVLPRAATLSWEDVKAIRSHRDIAYFRDVLREVESVAWSDSTSLSDFRLRIQEEYGDRLRDANRRMMGNVHGRAINASVGFVVGLLAGHIIPGEPVLSGVAASAVSLGIDEIRSRMTRTRWITVDQAIHRLISTDG